MDKSELLRKIDQCVKTGSTSLDLGGKQIASLPPAIGKLTNLQTLRLSSNKLANLPPELWKLTNLQGLYLSFNQLTELPPEIVKLSNLQFLTLWGNQLTKLPPEIGRLTKLQELGLEGNRFTELPPEITNLKNLQTLYLRSNRLTTLPPEIGNLVNLRELYLEGNQLTELPPEILQLTNLQTLSLEGNPLTLPPPEIVSQGAKAVLSYLDDLLKAPTKRYEAKLLILGDGGEGKTCISRALRGLPFASQRSTQGVDIKPWKFSHPTDPRKIVTLNIWDFEGQEINHQSHQFFLTERSLYIVVFNGRREFRLDRMEYWLETIRTRAPHSAVIIVATECGKATPSIPLDRLKAEFGDLLKTANFYFTTECETSYGISELVTQLMNCVLDKTILPLIGETWPKTYADAEKAIRETSESRSHISRYELHEIFKKSGIRNEDFDIVSSVMGDMGIITHFSNSMDLYDFIVLKPHWLTKAISLIMEDKELESNKGICTLIWLDHKWKFNYPGLTAIFHSAMKEFELCYELDSPNTSNISGVLDNSRRLTLVPLRFGYIKPLIPWSDIADAKERRIQYRFEATPPAGIMSRFIVKTHYMIAKPANNLPSVYWYNGVFLRTGDGAMRSEALCEFNNQTRTFNIFVKAAFPQNLIELLNGIAQAVFSFFAGLKQKRYYGCVKDGKQCAAYHSEETIMYTLSRVASKGFTGKNEIPCAEGLHIVDAYDLVYGFSSFADSASARDDVKDLLRKEIDKAPEWSKDISKDVGSVISRVDILSQKEYIAGRDIREIPASERQQFQLALRDYLNLFDDMKDNKDFTHVPSIISIKPVRAANILMTNLFSVTFRLTPYCESEDGIHDTEYYLDFEISRDWWRKTLPVAGSLFNILRVGLKAGSILDPTGSLNVLSGLANKAKSAAQDNTGELSDFAGTDVEKTYDLRFKQGYDEFRMVRLQLAELLKKLAPANYKAKQWGDLQLLRLKDNTYRWLCKKHADEYWNKF